MSDAAIQKMLEEGLEALGLKLDSEKVQALLGYHAFMMETNASLNLTGHKTPELSVVQNLLNSLGPWRQVHPTKASADIGSGGGFPGIPLAIALDMPHMVLIESKIKKAKFLKEACERFAPQVRVVADDANVVRERFLQLIFCGFGTLKKILHVARPSLNTKGRILAYKGSKDRIAAELAECAPSHRAWEQIPFTVPGLDAERHLCVWKRAED